GMLLTLLWTHGAARRLFDDTVAAVAVTALLVCEPLWELAVSGSPVGLLLPLMAAAFRLFTAAVTGDQQGGRPGLYLSVLGLVLGLVLAVAMAMPGRKTSAFWVAAVPVLSLAGWGWWMHQTCGDPTGGAKTLFQTHLLPLDASTLQRQFALGMPSVQIGDLLR